MHVAAQQDVNSAVAAARAAFTSWAAFDHEKRASILHKFADLLERDADKLAYLEAVCNVKPVKLFHGYELPQAVSIFRCTYPTFPHVPKANDVAGKNTDSGQIMLGGAVKSTENHFLSAVDFSTLSSGSHWAYARPSRHSMLL